MKNKWIWIVSALVLVALALGLYFGISSQEGRPDGSTTSSNATAGGTTEIDWIS